MAVTRSKKIVAATVTDHVVVACRAEERSQAGNPHPLHGSGDHNPSQCCARDLPDPPCRDQHDDQEQERMG